MPHALRNHSENLKKTLSHIVDTFYSLQDEPFDFSSFIDLHSDDHEHRDHHNKRTGDVLSLYAKKHPHEALHIAKELMKVCENHVQTTTKLQSVLDTTHKALIEKLSFLHQGVSVLHTDDIPSLKRQYIQQDSHCYEKNRSTFHERAQDSIDAILHHTEHLYHKKIIALLPVEVLWSYDECKQELDSASRFDIHQKSSMIEWYIHSETSMEHLYSIFDMLESHMKEYKDPVIENIQKSLVYRCIDCMEFADDFIRFWKQFPLSIRMDVLVLRRLLQESKRYEHILYVLESITLPKKVFQTLTEKQQSFLLFFEKKLIRYLVEKDASVSMLYRISSKTPIEKKGEREEFLLSISLCSHEEWKEYRQRKDITPDERIFISRMMFHVF